MKPSSRTAAASLALAFALAGCTHFGTNVAGDFACSTPKTGCQALAEVDALATRALLKDQAVNSGEARQRIGVLTGDNARTAERKLRVVFPAYVDAAGTLHEESAAWVVVEAPRWKSELTRSENDHTGPLDGLRKALRRAAQRALEAARSKAEGEPVAADPNSQTADASKAASATTSPPPSPPALPSPGGEASAGAKAAPLQAPAAEGSDMSPPLHDWTPRPFGGSQSWPEPGMAKSAEASSSDPKSVGTDNASTKPEPR